MVGLRTNHSVPPPAGLRITVGSSTFRPLTGYQQSKGPGSPGARSGESPHRHPQAGCGHYTEPLESRSLVLSVLFFLLHYWKTLWFCHSGCRVKVGVESTGLVHCQPLTPSSSTRTTSQQSDHKTLRSDQHEHPEAKTQPAP